MRIRDYCFVFIQVLADELYDNPYNNIKHSRIVRGILK